MRPSLRTTLGTLGLLVTLGLGVAACTAPQVNLQRAALGRLTTAGFQVNMDLQVFNPNTYTLPLRKVTWQLDLFNANFTKGAAAVSRNIGAGRRASVRVPLGIRFDQAAIGVQSFLSGRNIPWAILGRCDFQTPIGPVFVRFNDRGTWGNPMRGELGDDPNPATPSTHTIDMQVVGAY